MQLHFQRIQISFQKIFLALKILNSFEICWNMMKQGNGVSVENVSPTQKPLRRRRPPSLGCVVLSYILLFSSLLALNVYISQQWSEWKKEQCRSGCIQVRDNVLGHEWKIGHNIPLPQKHSTMPVFKSSFLSFILQHTSYITIPAKLYKSHF